MKHVTLITSLAIMTKVVAVLFWVFFIGIQVVPVAVDQTAIFGGPYLSGNRFIPGDFGEFPTDRTLAYRVRTGCLAGGTLLLIAITLCPHRLIGRHILAFWLAVVISTLPAIGMAYIITSSILTTTQSPTEWSIEDSLIMAAAFVLLEIGFLSLPASLILNQMLSRKDRVALSSEP